MTARGWARGEFSWYELGTTDLEAAKRFYGAVFGWTWEDVPMPEGVYSMVRLGDRDIGGAYRLEGPRYQGVPSHWLVYVATGSIDSDTRKATSIGGTLVTGPLDVPDVGRIAVLRDPQGASFALFQAGRHAGRGRLEGAPGSFCWSELQTTDTESAERFYTGVVGWGTEVLETGPDRYTQWRVGDDLVGGMMAIRPEWGAMPPNWLSYVSVSDCDVTVRKAEGLGAQVVAPPRDIEGVGRFAVMNDPQGAALAVIRLV